ncbi:hypothetical protein [Terrabacter carboxydivorans]|uniref:hypothetical protein n=1 Tax=Terrabacter carboxydivorans TaxID=619730 RepID=UPI0031E17A4A
MEQDDMNPQPPTGHGQTTGDSGYIGRHARPGKPDQGPDEDATYDARHDDIDGPPGAVQG